jgi:hypothetical protein
MNLRFILMGTAGMLSISSLTSRAQDVDTSPATTPPSVDKPIVIEAPAKPQPKPLPPIDHKVLFEKLKAAGANLSPTVQEIVKMSDAGADPAVIQTYVENLSPGYAPRAEEIIYMHDHGIPNSIITAMIQHGAKVREQTVAAQTTAVAAQQPPPPAPQDVNPPTYEAPMAAPYDPAPAYAYSGYPAYSYSYPPYYPNYWPSYGVYFSWPLYGRFHHFDRFGHHPGGFSGHALTGGRTRLGRSSSSVGSSGHTFHR